VKSVGAEAKKVEESEGASESISEDSEGMKRVAICTG
jgi:hypothetical protein